MKTEAEIRDHLADLDLVLSMACDTGEPGELLMRSHAELLRWVLGDQPDVDRLVGETRLDADGVRAAKKARIT